MDCGRWRIWAVVVLAVSASTAYGGPILLIEDQGGFGEDLGGYGSAEQALNDEGFETVVVNNEYDRGYATLLDTNFLKQFDFIVYGERGNGFGAAMLPAVAASLESYIQWGGDLLVTGYDTLGSPFDPILAQLVRSASAGDQGSNSPYWRTADVDHPILNGPFGDFRDLTFIGNGYDDDFLTADNLTAGDGAITLAITPGYSDRLIVANVGDNGGSVGYWNGGLSLEDEDFFGIVNAQPDFSFGGQPQGIFLNYADFAVDTNPVPEPASAALLLIGGCGLLAGYRRRMRPAP